jgi:hypothetical protein
MRTKTTLLTLLLVLMGLNATFAQVGIGTTTPKTTLQAKGDPANTTTADGVQVPSLTLAQLDAKVAAYGADQDGAIIFVNDISVASATTKTADITAKGFYYYDATTNKWKGVGKTPDKTYTIGLWPELGGYVFYVTPDGKHGLVAATKDQGSGSSWFNAQDSISSPANHNADGKKFTNWRLPTKYELNLVYSARLAIGGFVNFLYWSSSEFDSNVARVQLFPEGLQSSSNKTGGAFVRAVRAF